MQGAWLTPSVGIPASQMSAVAANTVPADRVAHPWGFHAVV